MPFTIRTFGRCTARVEDGVRCVLEGPPDVSVVLNAIAVDPPSGVHVDEQRLLEARTMYPDMHVLPDLPAHGHIVH